MTPADLFPLYSELALGLLGFVGVVSAFAGRDRVFMPTERIRFLGVVMASVVVLVGCFSFFAAQAAGMDEGMSLRLAGVGPLLISLAELGILMPATVRAARDPESTTEPWSLAVSFSVLATNIVLGGAAIAAIASYACLVLGFSITLLHGIWMFVRVLTRRN